VALASDSRVTLAWDVAASAAVVGFVLERRGPADADFVTLATLTRDVSAVGDPDVVNGSTYHYRLHYLFASGPGSNPAEDHATPGRARPWVSDVDAGALLRLTADGRHVVDRVEGQGLGAPAELAVDPGLGIVWASDVANGEVLGVLSSSVRPYRITGFLQPGAIAIDPLDHTLWVCDELAGSLRHLQPTGAPALPSSLGPFSTPLAVVIDPLDRSLWMGERDGDRVRRFAASGTQLGEVVVSSPSRLAIDSLTRDVWVTSVQAARVVRLSSELAPEDTLTGFEGPVGVAVDARRGRVWIADPVAGQLVALTRDGAVEFRVGGLPGVRAVAVDLASGEAWAAVSSAGRVVRVSPTGAVLESVAGLVRPWSVVLIP
jgi:streptogramin lyase